MICDVHVVNSIVGHRQQRGCSWSDWAAGVVEPLRHNTDI